MPFGAAFGCLLGAGKTSPATVAGAVRTIPHRQLYISEPNPVYFGNRPNPQLGEPGWTNRNWLKSRFHFNFAEYDGGSDSFGVLRVMNDDLVQPKRGFGMHPHRDMEVITFIVDGQLTHRDSMGTEETLGRGGVQYMTAGTGIQHSEHNLQNEALRFVQCWVVPRRRGLRPKYGSMAGTKENEALRQNQWAHIVCDAEGSQKAPVRIYQDCNVFLSELSPGVSLPKMELQAGRQGYLLCVEGSVQLADADGKVQRLQQHDAAELTGPLCLQPKAEKAAMLLLFEMEQTHRGY